jgi:hypothetical protein
MLELKYKKNGYYTLKGLTVDQLITINTLVSHVRLGQGTAGSQACYELGDLFESEGFDLDEMELTVTRDVPDEDVNYMFELT